MIWRRVLFFGVAVVTGLLLETTLLASRTLGGTQPEIVLLVVIAVAMEEGPSSGAVAGFVGGLMTDLMLDLPAGLSSFVFTAVGYAVGALREHYEGTTAWLRIAVAAIATAAGVLGYGALAGLVGVDGILAVDLLRHAGLAAAYAMLLAPFVMPIIRRLSMRLRPQKVVKL